MRGTLLLAIAACGGGAIHAHDAAQPTDTPADASSATACPAGSSLVVDRTSCPGAIVAPPASLLAATAQPGDIVSLDGLAEGALPCVPAVVCAPDNAATMLFSDDPESPTSDGVLYADTFGPGRARVYVYHVNAGSASRKFPIVVLNQNASDAHVTIVREGLGGPSTDYIDVGKAVAAAWLASNASTVVTIPSGARVVLDASLDALHAQTNELVHAIVDVDCDVPVKLSIVSVLANEDAATLTASLPLLANDGLHDRGTFAGAEVWLAASAGGEGASARHLRLGDGTTEPELAGKDATTGMPATLHGNYGVVYRMSLDARDPIRVLASARGGAWAGAAAAGTVVALPATAGGLADPSAAVWLDALPTGPAELTLISGGGSSLPVDAVVVAN